MTQQHTCSLCKHALSAVLHSFVHQRLHAGKLPRTCLSAAVCIGISHDALHCGLYHVSGHVTLLGLELFCHLGQQISAFTHFMSLHLKQQEALLPTMLPESACEAYTEANIEEHIEETTFQNACM